MDAITAEQAQTATASFFDRDSSSIEDLAIPLAPSTIADATFYSDGSEFFPPMLDDIAAAEDSIHILMFTITPGEVAEEAVATIAERVADGVEVRMIVDRYGGKVDSRSSALFDRPTTAGVQVVVNDIFPMDRDGPLGDREIDWWQDEVGNADHRKMSCSTGRSAGSVARASRTTSTAAGTTMSTHASPTMFSGRCSWFS